VTLWCDLKTRLPRKRITSTTDPGDNRQHFSEVYDDWVINADIADDKFKLPEK
jgi:outer membrane lipoprotein-sorting protein